MDGLSLAASIVAVLGLTGKVLKYAKAVKDGPSERSRLLKDVINVQGLLHALQSHVELSEPDDPWMRAAHGLADPGGPLDLYKASLERLLNKLEPEDDKRRNVIKKIGSSIAWPFQAGEISSILGTIERQQGVFNLAISLDSAALNRAIYNEVQDNKRLHRAMTSDLKQAGADIQKILDRSRTETEIKVLEWLSSMKFLKEHADIKAKRTPGTARWVIETETFKNWLNGSSSNVMWCTGIPGSGKTFVASLIIDHLVDRASSHQAILAFVYCDYKSNQKDPERAFQGVVGGLLRYLLASEESLPNDLLDLYQRHSRSSGSFPLSQLEDLLVSFCQHHPSYIVLDALDEFGPDRRSLLKLLKRLENTSAKLFYTARAGQKDIERHLRDRPRVQIEASEADIVQFLSQRIEERIEEEEEYEDLLTQDLKDEITSTLVNRSRGMFLLPDLQIRSVLDQMSPAKIREALTKLPEGLEDQFEATLQRISNQPRDRRDLAFRTLMWVSHLRETTDINTLQHALAVELGDQDLDYSRLTPLSLLRTSVTDFCQGLVTVQKDTSQVRLVHHTLSEYLYDQRIESSWFVRSEQYVTEICLTYLLFKNFGAPIAPENDSPQESMKLFPLYDYAARCWGIHAHRLYHHQTPSTVVDLIYRLLFSPSHLHRSAQAFAAPGREVFSTNPARLQLKGMMPVHFSAIFGLPQIANEAVRRGQDINARIDGDLLGSWTALHFVAANDITDQTGSWMVHHILSLGANINAQNKEGDTPMMLAITRGRDSTLRSLLAAHADAEIQLENGTRALHLAAEYGSEEAVKMLLDYGCDTSARMVKGRWTPLFYAIDAKRQKNVDALLRGGADVNIQDVQGNHPIHVAARSGIPDIIVSLLDRGVSIESHDNNFLTPLMVAAAGREGGADSMRLLLDRGAKVKPRSRANDSALLFAALGGDNESVKLLLDAGAEIHGKHEGLDTALHTAASKGHVAICRTLLERGAEVDPLNQWENAPLQLCVEGRVTAVESGLFLDVMKLLFEYHANVNLRASEGWTALQRAARVESDDSDAVKLLLDQGADIEAINDLGQTALHLATLESKPNIVKALMQAGASLQSKTQSGSTALHLAARDSLSVAGVLLEGSTSKEILETKDQAGMTPLHVAATTGNIDTSGLLLDQKISTETEDDAGQTALHYATGGNHADLVRLLIQHGAALEKTMPNGSTALHIAASNGHLDTVRVLTEHGALIDAGDAEGYTPFVMACESGYEAIALLLLEKGADINAHATIGKQIGTNSLYLASQSGHVDIVKLLLSKNVELGSIAEDPTWSALHAAAGHNHLPVVRELLETDLFEINATAGPRTLTPLHFAVINENMDMLNLLLSKGAALQVEDGSGFTALYTACAKDNDVGTEMCRIMLSKGADVSYKSADGFNYLPIAAKYGPLETVRLLIDNGAYLNVAGPQGYRPLLMAVQGSKIEHARLLLERGADVNGTDDSGDTALHQVCRSDSEDLLKLLLDHNANTEITNESGDTPLFVATLFARVLMIRRLLEKGANPEARDSSDYTVLRRTVVQATAYADFIELSADATAAALAMMDEEDVQVSATTTNLPSPTSQPVQETDGGLINENASPPEATERIKDDVEQGESIEDKSLDFRRKHADYEGAIRLLLSHNAVLDATDSLSHTSLYSAALAGDIRLMRLLLSYNADPTIGGSALSSPFIGSIYSGSIACIALLLDTTAYALNAQSTNAMTPLFAACMQDDKSAFHYLLSRGADLEATNADGETPLFSVLRTSAPDAPTTFLLSLSPTPNLNTSNTAAIPALHIASVRLSPQTFSLFLSHSPTLTTLAPNAETALHWTWIPEHLPNFLLLLQAGADPNVADAQGRLPLVFTAHHGSSDHATALLDHGADVNLTGTGDGTALAHASWQGHEELVSLLLAHGADVDVRDRDGDTAFLEACRWGHEGVVRLLVEAGADTGVRNKNGRGGAFLAALKGHRGVLELLWEIGVGFEGTDEQGVSVGEAARRSGFEEVARWVEGLLEEREGEGEGEVRTLAVRVKEGG